MGMVHPDVWWDRDAAHTAAENALGWLAQLWGSLRDSDPDLARQVVAVSAAVERIRAVVEPAGVGDRRGVLVAS